MRQDQILERPARVFGLGRIDGPFRLRLSARRVENRNIVLHRHDQAVLCSPHDLLYVRREFNKPQTSDHRGVGRFFIDTSAGEQLTQHALIRHRPGRRRPSRALDVLRQREHLRREGWVDDHAGVGQARKLHVVEFVGQRVGDLDVADRPPIRQREVERGIAAHVILVERSDHSREMRRPVEHDHECRAPVAKRDCRQHSLSKSHTALEGYPVRIVQRAQQ